jgi:hypothetical protein
MKKEKEKEVKKCYSYWESFHGFIRSYDEFG